MKFKKGDLVEVIKEDEYQGFIFHKGSQWVVYSDQFDDDIIRVCDDRHPFNYSILWTDSVKKVDSEFKKGDIVKVIKEDCFGDSVYPVGSVWEVDSVLPGSLLLVIKDSRQDLGTGVLFSDRVKKLNPCNPRFKIGDMVRVKSSIYCNDNSIGKIYRVENVKTSLEEYRGIVYLDTGVSDDHTQLWVYRFNEIELANDNSYMELVDIIQEQIEEIKSLKEENQKLITKVSRLEAVRINYAQRVRDLIAENEILKDDLKRKKFFKNLLTGKKD